MWGISTCPRTQFKKGHKGLRGRNHPRWKGGKSLTHGYVEILRPNHTFAHQKGYVPEHRFIIEKYIGRYLLITEIVHHVNENKIDNNLKNLMVFISKSAHVRFHKNPNNVKKEEIVFDGRKL